MDRVLAELWLARHQKPEHGASLHPHHLHDHPHGFHDDYHDQSLTLVIIIIMSQVLGHMNFNKKDQLENFTNLLSLNDVAINHLLSHQSHVKLFPDMKISDLHSLM